MEIILKALADKNRLKIINFIKDKPKCVCEIYPFLGITQNLTSHHLSALKNANLIKSEKKGRHIYYSLNKKTFYNIRNFFDNFLISFY
jgi:ArsR family transcriptional regulator